MVAGPGHVSPFELRDLALEARYGADAGLEALSVAAGPFTLRLAR